MLENNEVTDESLSLSKVKWLCRRGTKELDVILERFSEEQYHQLTINQKQQFITLLQCEDDLLADWLCSHKKNIKKGLENIVTQILSTQPPSGCS